jgi:hypothetical protein
LWRPANKATASPPCSWVVLLGGLGRNANAFIVACFDDTGLKAVSVPACAAADARKYSGSASVESPPAAAYDAQYSCCAENHRSSEAHRSGCVSQQIAGGANREEYVVSRIDLVEQLSSDRDEPVHVLRDEELDAVSGGYGEMSSGYVDDVAGGQTTYKKC